MREVAKRETLPAIGILALDELTAILTAEPENNYGQPRTTVDMRLDRAIIWCGFSGRSTGLRSGVRMGCASDFCKVDGQGTSQLVRCIHPKEGARGDG